MTDSHGLYPTLAAVSLVLDAADIIATATGVIKAKLYGLQENPNAHYWREVVHVVWEQLAIWQWWNRQKAGHTGTKSLMHLMQIYKIMHGEVEQVAMMDKGKGKAVNPLFGCGEDVTMPSDVHASNDTGEEHRGQTRSCLACREQHSHSQSQKHQKGMTSMPTLNMDVNMLVAMESAPTLVASTGIHGHYIAAINSPPDGFSIVEEGQRCNRCRDRNLTCSAKPGWACWQCNCTKSQPHYLPIHQLLAHPIRGMHQARASHLTSQGDQAAITPSPAGKYLMEWLYPSPSVAANTGSTSPTTPSSTGSAGGDNTARIDTLEAKVLVLKKELVVKSHQLDDTQCKVSSLHDIVEALQQEHYPLAQGLMCPIHYTTTPQPGPMLPSTCHAITPAMVTPLSYTQQVDLALTTMVEEVPSHPNTPINDTSEMQQQPPHSCINRRCPHSY
ncbi:hypothetical protein V8B97DRAFT_1919137 [Scleroderma yunnanense]